MVAAVNVVESELSTDIVNVIMTASVSIQEAVEAQDSTSATTYVIVVVAEQGNAVDVYFCAPIFQSSEVVWHVLPRATNWELESRLNNWDVLPRATIWEVEQRNDYWDILPRADYWKLNE